MKLYTNIRNLRELAGFSQEELARKVGYKDRTSIAKIEAGKIDIPQSKIIAFAKALGVTPVALMGWEEYLKSVSISIKDSHVDAELPSVLNDFSSNRVFLFTGTIAFELSDTNICTFPYSGSSIIVKPNTLIDASIFPTTLDGENFFVKTLKMLDPQSLKLCEEEVFRALAQLDAFDIDEGFYVDFEWHHSYGQYLQELITKKEPIPQNDPVIIAMFKKMNRAISDAQNELGLGRRSDILRQYARWIHNEYHKFYSHTNFVKSEIPSFSYPFAEAVSAGLPVSINGVTALPEITVPDVMLGKYAHNKHIIIMPVNGRSMDKIIPNESYIAVKTDIEIFDLKDGDIVVFSRAGEYAVKLFYDTGSDLIFRPASTDPVFRDLVISKENAEDIEIVGKVVMYNIILG